jgi:micrococcal nuclease
VATVLHVLDGHTIQVDLGGAVLPVRYLGVASPPLVGPAGQPEPLALEALEVNRRLVGGETIFMARDISEADGAGRLLRYVWVGNVFINGSVIRLGFGQANASLPDTRYVAHLQALEEEARRMQRGLWGPFSRRPQPPHQAVATALALQPPTETASERPQPTAWPAAGSAGLLSAGPSCVAIVHIHHRGDPSVGEADEYCEIANRGGTAANLQCWRLNAGSPGQDLLFPDLVLQPGQKLRVYTGSGQAVSGVPTFGRQCGVWHDEGDCGRLYDARGSEVSTYCYP